MNGTTLALTMGATICISIGLLGGLVLVTDVLRKLNRLIADASALQRMVTTHGDSQLSTDGRLKHIELELMKLQQRNLQLQSLTAGYTSFENAAVLVEEAGVTDAERLALESGLTEREANLMIQLRSSYSTDTTSPADGAK